MDAQTARTLPFSFWEHQNNFTVALGFDWLVRLGLGYTAQSFSTEIYNPAPIGVENGATNCSSYGAILEIPVVALASSLSKKPLTINTALDPVLNLTLAWAERNVGSDTSIVSPFVIEPIPRQSVLGLNLLLGIETEVAGKRWRILSFIFAREASDLLVASSTYYLPAYGFPFYSYYYRGGLGDISPIDNLIFGQSNGNMEMRRGWQLQVAELLYLRGGSATGPGGLNYSTLGFGLRLDGLVNTLAAYQLIDIATPGIWKFISGHLDLRYDHSAYSGDNSLTGTNFQSLNLIVK